MITGGKILIDLNNYHANYVAVNNGRLYYEIAGNGDPLVFVPASILDRRIWDDQFHYFSQTHTVLRYDMRGFGKSETLPGTYAYHEEYLQTLASTTIQKFGGYRRIIRRSSRPRVHLGAF